MKPYMGKIKDWSIEKHGLHFVITGTCEDSYIRTSRIYVFAPLEGVAHSQ